MCVCGICVRLSHRAKRPAACAFLVFPVGFLILASHNAAGAVLWSSREAIAKAVADLGAHQVAEAPDHMPNAANVKKLLSVHPVQEVVDGLVGTYRQAKDAPARARAIAALRIVLQSDERKKAPTSGECYNLIMNTAQAAILDPDDTVALEAYKVLDDSCMCQGDLPNIKLRLKSAKDKKLSEALLDGVARCGDFETLLEYSPKSPYEAKDSEAIETWRQRLGVGLFNSLGLFPNREYSEQLQDKLVDLIRRDPDVAGTVLRFFAEARGTNLVPRLKRLQETSQDMCIKDNVRGALVLLEPASGESKRLLLARHDLVLREFRTRAKVWPVLQDLNMWLSIVAEKTKDGALLALLWNRYRGLAAQHRGLLLGDMLNYACNSRDMTIPLLDGMPDGELVELFKAHPPLAENVVEVILDRNSGPPRPGEKRPEPTAAEKRLRALVDQARGTDSKRARESGGP